MKYDDFELLDGKYPLPATEAPAGTLHIWTQDDVQWACRAYDHGPFCRRCTKLDGIAAACIQSVLDGLLMLFDDPDKGLSFKITETGKARVETAIRRGGFSEGLDA